MSELIKGLGLSETMHLGFFSDSHHLYIINDESGEIIQTHTLH
ncbi:hypothetical protein NVP1052A_72 [Vibrio phage 1.052.A._10N.286.46.C3]|nr:hypothetical protein NVP1052A_72 [Vibrio phage 1.052.A._10N.286.46.C3]